MPSGVLRVIFRSPMKVCVMSTEILIEEIVMSAGGTFSAEHGIGQVRNSALTKFRSATELDLMRRVKHALDPDMIMNPGKILTRGIA